MLATHKKPGSFSLQHHTNAEKKERLRLCKTSVRCHLTSPIYFQGEMYNQHPLASFVNLHQCVHISNQNILLSTQKAAWFLEGTVTFKSNESYRLPVPLQLSCLLSQINMHLQIYFQGSGFKTWKENRIRYIKASLGSNTDGLCQVTISKVCLWCYLSLEKQKFHQAILKCLQGQHRISYIPFVQVSVLQLKEKLLVAEEGEEGGTVCGFTTRDRVSRSVLPALQIRISNYVARVMRGRKKRSSRCVNILKALIFGTQQSRLSCAIRCCLYNLGW